MTLSAMVHLAAPVREKTVGDIDGKRQSVYGW